MNKHDQPPPYGYLDQQSDMITSQPVQVNMQPPLQQQVIVVGATNPCGPNSQPMSCPSCHRQIHTKTTSEAVTKTHLMALLLCCFCCWPCVCVPYCMNSCQNINHYCPHCNTFLGTYSA